MDLHPESCEAGAALADTPTNRPVAISQDDAVDDEHLLKGLHFLALKAPGPSGSRLEHISEILGIRRKRLARRALRALHKGLKITEIAAHDEGARWITRSRTIFLEKKR